MKVESGTECLGWREWLALPDLGIPAIKAKIDTGARTSALHTFKLETITHQGRSYVRFWVHPLQRRTDIEIVCESPIVDQRMVRDSGGHAEQRYVIETTMELGGRNWITELTLTSRDEMLFRMLLGRSALAKGGFMVRPETSYRAGRELRKAYKHIKTDKTQS